MAKKILFIEDESALQKTLGEVLTQEGYAVVSALDGEEGLKLAKSEKPDLVLLDLIIPKMTGFEVLKEIKKDPDINTTPVIVLTNLGSMEDIEKAVQLGATTYLVKADYDLDDVLKKVKDALGD